MELDRISYRALLAHRLKHFWHSGSRTNLAIKGFFIGGFVLYMAFILASLGYALPDFLELMGETGPIVPLVNSVFLPVLIVLIPSRYFLQRALKMDFRPYLTLPIPRKQLARFALISELSSLFNILPFAFLIPFAIVHVSGVTTLAGLALWFLSVTLAILATHYITVALRLLQQRNRKLFFGFITVTGLVIAADLGMGYGGLVAMSDWLLSSALVLNPVPIGVTTLLVGAFMWVSDMLLEEHLKMGGKSSHVPLLGLTPAIFDHSASETSRLLVLDWTLLLRNRRPRRSLLLAFFFAVMNAPLLLTPGFGSLPLVGALAAGFGLVLLPSSYGQYLFAWDSPHFDGLLSLPISSRPLIRSRLLMMQLMSFASFLALFPFFYLLAPEHLLLLVAFLFYMAGIACPALMYVGLWNDRGLQLSEGAFLNYEGMTAKQFLVNIPIFVPPIGLLLLIDLTSALILLTGVGIVGVIVFPLWIILFDRIFNKKKLAMAAGFRTRDK